MTIPGKGGRPRKWRSDADRQRAWRARQSGLGEPPTVAEALDEGDELAGAWEIVRDLGEQLHRAKATIDELRADRNQLQRDAERDWRRYAWLESRVEAVEAERDRLEADLAELTAGPVEELENPDGRPGVSEPPIAARLTEHSRPALSRAARRQLERRQRRRGN